MGFSLTPPGCPLPGSTLCAERPHPAGRAVAGPLGRVTRPPVVAQAALGTGGPPGAGGAGWGAGTMGGVGVSPPRPPRPPQAPPLTLGAAGAVPARGAEAGAVGGVAGGAVGAGAAQGAALAVAPRGAGWGDTSLSPTSGRGGVRSNTLFSGGHSRRWQVGPRKPGAHVQDPSWGEQVAPLRQEQGERQPRPQEPWGQLCLHCGPAGGGGGAEMKAKGWWHSGVPPWSLLTHPAGQAVTLSRHRVAAVGVGAVTALPTAHPERPVLGDGDRLGS